MRFKFAIGIIIFRQNIIPLSISYLNTQISNLSINTRISHLTLNTHISYLTHAYTLSISNLNTHISYLKVISNAHI